MTDAQQKNRERQTSKEGVEPAPSSWSSRLLWFVGLWLAGVGTLTVLSYGIRAMIMP